MAPHVVTVRGARGSGRHRLIAEVCRDASLLEGRCSSAVVDVQTKYFAATVELVPMLAQDSFGGSGSDDDDSEQGPPLAHVAGNVSVVAAGVDPRQWYGYVSSSQFLFNAVVVNYRDTAPADVPRRRAVWEEYCVDRGLEAVEWPASAAAFDPAPEGVERAGLLAAEPTGSGRVRQLLFNTMWVAPAAPPAPMARDKVTVPAASEPLPPLEPRPNGLLLFTDAMAATRAALSGPCRLEEAAAPRPGDRLGTTVWDAVVQHRYGRATVRVHARDARLPSAAMRDVLRGDVHGTAHQCWVCHLTERASAPTAVAEWLSLKAACDTECTAVLLLDAGLDGVLHTAAIEAQCLEAGVEVVWTRPGDDGAGYDPEEGALGLRRLREAIDCTPWAMDETVEHTGTVRPDAAEEIEEAAEAHEETVEVEASSGETVPDTVLFVGCGLSSADTAVFANVVCGDGQQSVVRTPGVVADGVDPGTVPLRLTTRYYDAELRGATAAVSGSLGPALGTALRRFQAVVLVVDTTQPAAVTAAREAAAALSPSACGSGEDDDAVLAGLLGGDDRVLCAVPLPPTEAALGALVAVAGPGVEVVEGGTADDQIARVAEALAATRWPGAVPKAHRCPGEGPSAPLAAEEESGDGGADATDDADPLAPPLDPATVHGCALPPGMVFDRTLRRTVRAEDQAAMLEAGAAGGAGDLMGLMARMRQVKEHGAALGREERERQAATLARELATMLDDG